MTVWSDFVGTWHEIIIVMFAWHLLAKDFRLTDFWTSTVFLPAALSLSMAYRLPIIVRSAHSNP